MKYSLISIIILMLFTSVVFSQSKAMLIEYVGGNTTTINVSSISKITFVDSTFNCGSSTVFYQGVDYNTVLIGSQCWMKENLRVGTKIAGNTNQSNNSTIEKYCYDDNDANCTTYGGLYQWAEAVAYTNGATNTTSPSPAFSGNIQGICPPGWHIPTIAEFETLKTAVGEDGNALKAVGQGTGTNTSGFSALMAGYRSSTFSNFASLGTLGATWSLTETTSPNVNYLELGEGGSNITLTGSTNKAFGFSVRCLKD